MNSIILIGFKSCGKSTIGAMLAHELGLSFVDTDHLIEQRHTAATGETLTFREIVHQHGEQYFRALEGEVVADLPNFTDYVIAVGGGTFIHHTPPEILRERAALVYLDVDPNILFRRILAGGRPAFFKGNDLAADFARHFHERDPIYQRLAHHQVRVGSSSVAHSVRRIRQALNL